MNHKGNEFFSKVEKNFNVKLGRFDYCPVCRQEGKTQDNNPLVMEHRLDDYLGIAYHRWSYSTGRMIGFDSEDSNVL